MLRFVGTTAARVVLIGAATLVGGTAVHTMTQPQIPPEEQKTTSTNMNNTKV
ncbi:hypothetical protein I4U23_031469 [Adineta vaga]|nr:hypothetical protein I4U23_031469 [Adineta vaga]